MSNERGAGRSEVDRLASVDLNLLVPLLAVLEECSVTRAAERVGLSQPAMSHALARMRRLLGDDLLVRQGRASTLTPRGLELLGPVRAALRQVGEVVRFPGFDPATDQRTITVALTTSTAFVVGPAILQIVSQRAPHASVRLRTVTVPSEGTFTDQGVDVVLVSEGYSTTRPRERLYDDRLVVMASPEASGDLDAMGLLTALLHVVVDTEPLVFPYPVLDELGVAYRVGHRVTDFLLVPHLVAHAGGVGLLRRRVAERMAATAPARIEEVPFALPGLGIDMVWNPHLSDGHFIAWFRQVLLDAARTLG